MHKQENSRAKKVRTLVDAANYLSLGISVVVAILIGVGLGILLAKLYKPLFFVGLGFGIAAAILNVYKAYKLLVKSTKKKNNH
ncbi:ATPase_gene1 domain-containing protein [Campylobacter sp. RM5004]|uniref:AtpZ/AtpI family protein n=1 Tax=Campylobacter sp. RM5004 TaxID=1660078 RepID=UPI001EFAD2D9|nr:AtpZ/AtpI family protein [Campylobacter sp. RM5004]ULO01952.1 ATPase_gene1 domain-containing protein [Campylobacter sp. RM5004]